MKTEPNDFVTAPNGLIGGLTKREHFAAMAMQGYCANGHYCEASYEVIASMSVKQADVLIAELNKEETK